MWRLFPIISTFPIIPLFPIIPTTTKGKAPSHLCDNRLEDGVRRSEILISALPVPQGLDIYSKGWEYLGQKSVDSGITVKPKDDQLPPTTIASASTLLEPICSFNAFRLPAVCLKDVESTSDLRAYRLRDPRISN